MTTTTTTTTTKKGSVLQEFKVEQVVPLFPPLLPEQGRYPDNVCWSALPRWGRHDDEATKNNPHAAAAAAAAATAANQSRRIVVVPEIQKFIDSILTVKPLEKEDNDFLLLRAAVIVGLHALLCCNGSTVNNDHINNNYYYYNNNNNNTQKPDNAGRQQQEQALLHVGGGGDAGDVEIMLDSTEDDDDHADRSNERSEWMLQQHSVIRKAYQVLLKHNNNNNNKDNSSSPSWHSSSRNRSSTTTISSLGQWCRFLQTRILPRLILVAVEHPVYTYASTQVSYLTITERHQVANVLLLHWQKNDTTTTSTSSSNASSSDSSSSLSALKLIKDLQDAHPPQLHAVLLLQQQLDSNKNGQQQQQQHYNGRRRRHGGDNGSKQRQEEDPRIIIPPHSCFPNAHWQLVQRRRRNPASSLSSSSPSKDDDDDDEEPKDEESTSSSTTTTLKKKKSMDDFVVHLVATYDMHNEETVDRGGNNKHKEEDDDDEASSTMVTVSRIINETCWSVEDRERQISLVLGHSCSCLKCRFEASSSTRSSSLALHVLRGGQNDDDYDDIDGMSILQQDHISAHELLHLARSYMTTSSVVESTSNDDTANKSSPLDVAKKIYLLVVSKFPSCSLEAKHALGAIELSRGRFLAAQRIWQQAQMADHDTAVQQQQSPNESQQKQELPHAGLVDQWDKLQAFGYLEAAPPPDEKAPSDVPDPSTKINNSRSIFPGGAFRTVDMVSVDQCKTILDWVTGANTKNAGGKAGVVWTQQRHYAVPTQDIPIHKCADIPLLLPWFNTWMRQHVCPLLARLFETSCNYYVHDAFIVRYEATSPYSYLPIHVDESSHSLVLALNDDYQGGGTYFYTANKTIQLQTGELLSFRGDQFLHGGQAVTRGVRYILAIFLFHDDDNDDDDDNGSGNIPTTNGSSSSSSSNRRNNVHDQDGTNGVKLMPDAPNNSTKQMKRSVEDDDNKETISQAFRASKEQKTDFSFGFLETSS